MVDQFKISSFIPRLIEPGSTRPYERMFRATEMLDRLGFHTGYIGHHSFTSETPDASAPMVVLGALAARTENIRLGTGIYLAALHHPANVIEQVSQVDQVSGGRVTLGVGVGYRPYEYEGYNVDFNSRGRRLTDMVRYMKHAWSTGRHGWDSEFFSIRDNLVYAKPDATDAELEAAALADREIDVRDLKPGMVLARDLLSHHGVILLAKGFVFEPRIIRHVREFAEREGRRLMLHVSKASLAALAGDAAPATEGATHG